MDGGVSQGKCIYHKQWKKFYFVVFNHGHNITAKLKIMIDGREQHKNLEFIKNLKQGFLSQSAHNIFLVQHEKNKEIGCDIKSYSIF